MGNYYSYAEQVLHYFDRPHQAPPHEPVGGIAAWRGSDVSEAGDWIHELTAEEVGDLERALEHACAAGKPTAELTTADFPLTMLAPALHRWRDEVDRGRGFLVVRGVPVSSWTADQAERFFWCLGLHMGRPGTQNTHGDLLGHVTDTGDDAADPYVRLYRTSSNIAYHCDAADMVGLLCLRRALSGGASRIVSSVSVHDRLLKQRPDLALRLYEPFLLDIRNEDSSGELRYVPVPPCRHADGRLRTFYHSDYFRSVVRHQDVEPLGEVEQAVLDLYEEIASDPDLYLDMDLEPGDIQWLSNHTVMHARTAYRDAPEPERKRHLLRLWLSVDREARAG